MSTVQTNRIQHSSGTGNNIILSADGDTQVNSLNGGPLAGFRNQIINGCLRNWQRGPASNSTTYGADRMFFANPGTGGNNERDTNAPPESGLQYAYAINPSAILVNSVEISSNGAPFVNGSQWTFSFYSRLDIRETSDNEIQFAAGNAAASNAKSLASGFTWAKEVLPSTWRRYSYTFTVGSDPNSGNNCLRLWFRNAGNRNTVTGFQLEPGPVATPFEHRPIGTELALCQRYYQQGQGSYRETNPKSAAGTYSTINFPTPMRAAPTFPSPLPYITNDASRLDAMNAQRITNYSFVASAAIVGSTGDPVYGQFSWTADAEL